MFYDDCVTRPRGAGAGGREGGHIIILHQERADCVNVLYCLFYKGKVPFQDILYSPARGDTFLAR